MKRPKPGTVIQISLPNGKFAYGRLYEDASIGIYTEVSDTPGRAPIGSRDFQFNVGVYNDALASKKCEVIGEDPFAKGEDPWPPPHRIVDPISGECSIYHRGETKVALPEECEGLEVAAVWELEHIIDRILNGSASRYLQSLRQGMPKRKSSVH